MNGVVSGQDGLIQVPEIGSVPLPPGCVAFAVVAVVPTPAGLQIMAQCSPNLTPKEGRELMRDAFLAVENGYVEHLEREVSKDRGPRIITGHGPVIRNG